MRQTTAGEMHAGSTPDDFDDAYVLLPGMTDLVEIWDYGVELDDAGKVVLFGHFPDMAVPKDHPIYFSPPERYK